MLGDAIVNVRTRIGRNFGGMCECGSRQLATSATLFRAHVCVCMGVYGCQCVHVCAVDWRAARLTAEQIGGHSPFATATGRAVRVDLVVLCVPVLRLY